MLDGVWTGIDSGERQHREGLVAKRHWALFSSSREFVGDEEMKTIRISVFCAAIALFMSPVLCAQDLSKYRSFSLETSLANVLKHTDQRLTDVKTIHDGTELIQELTWWPTSLRGANFPSESVEQILFSFYKGRLYKISVLYDRNAVEGLTINDMVRSLSAKYGTPTKLTAEADLSTNDHMDSKQKVIASWEDSLYDFDLVRPPYSDVFGLVMFSKRLNVQAEMAIAGAMKLDEQDRPQKEAAQRKKEADDLEMTRNRNRKIFQP